MSKQIERISAVLVRNQKYIKGTIVLSEDSITFVDAFGNGQVTRFNWASCKYIVSKEKVSIVFFIKKERPGFCLEDGEGHKISFIADQIEYSNYQMITNLFDSFKKNAYKKEQERTLEIALKCEQKRLAEEKRKYEDELRIKRDNEEHKEQERLRLVAERIEREKNEIEEKKKSSEIQREKELGEKVKIRYITKFISLLELLRQSKFEKELEEQEEAEKLRLQGELIGLFELIKQSKIKKEKEERRIQERLAEETRKQEDEKSSKIIAKEGCKKTINVADEYVSILKVDGNYTTDIAVVNDKDNNEHIEQMPTFIAEIYHSNEASYAISCGASLVFDFWIKAYNCEDVNEYLSESSFEYDEVVAYILNYTNDRNIVTKFEKLVENIYDDCVDDLTDYEEYISELLYEIVENISPKYGTVLYDEKEYVDIRKVYKNMDGFNISILDLYEGDFVNDDYLDWVEYRREKYQELQIQYQRQYKSVLLYVQKQKVPFTIQQIINNVQGVTKSVVRDVLLKEEKILNFYKEYIWYDNLKITEGDEDFIKSRVIDLVADYETHHVSELFDIIQLENLSLLKKYMLTTPHRLFSVSKYICTGVVATDRPYFAKNGIRIKNAQERLELFISKHKKLSVKSLIEYADENYMQIGNIIQTINGLNRTHIFMDKHNLILAECYNIDKTVANELEKVIIDEVKKNKVMGVCELTCVSKLPDINIPWNEWLIYSLLYKWSERLSVDTVGNNYRNAIPIVFLEDYLDASEIEKIEKRCSGKFLGSVLDITDIDAVLEDTLDDILADLEI